MPNTNAKKSRSEVSWLLLITVTRASDHKVMQETEKQKKWKPNSGNQILTGKRETKNKKQFSLSISLTESVKPRYLCLKKVPKCF